MKPNFQIWDFPRLSLCEISNGLTKPSTRGNFKQNGQEYANLGILKQIVNRVFGVGNFNPRQAFGNLTGLVRKIF